MKVSEITVDDLAEYLHLDSPTTTEETLLETLLGVAKDFIKGYTGQTDLDTKDSFTIVVFVLVQDMFDNRSLTLDKDTLNPIIANILGMYSINLL